MLSSCETAVIFAIPWLDKYLRCWLLWLYGPVARNMEYHTVLLNGAVPPVLIWCMLLTCKCPLIRSLMNISFDSWAKLIIEKKKKDVDPSGWLGVLASVGTKKLLQIYIEYIQFVLRRVHMYITYTNRHITKITQNACIYNCYIYIHIYIVCMLCTCVTFAFFIYLNTQRPGIFLWYCCDSTCT